MAEKIESKKDPKVVIMGEEIDTVHKNCGLGNAVWGAVWIVAGIILLLNTFDLVPWEVWTEVVKFWPMLIVLAGMQILLGNSTPGKVAAGFLTLVVLFWVFLYALHNANPELLKNLPAGLTQSFNYINNLQR